MSPEPVKFRIPAPTEEYNKVSRRIPVKVSILWHKVNWLVKVLVLMTPT